MIESSLKLGIAMTLVRPCNTRLTAYSIIGAVKEVVFQLVSSAAPQPPLRDVVRGLLEFGLGGILAGIRLPLLGGGPVERTGVQPEDVARQAVASMRASGLFGRGTL